MGWLKTQIEMENTKREIHAAIQILEAWKCLEHLTPSEKERISQQLKQIALAAINDYKNEVSKLSNKLYQELN